MGCVFPSLVYVSGKRWSWVQSDLHISIPDIRIT